MTLNGTIHLSEDAFDALVVRARLSQLDRARLIAKRRKVYERLHKVSLWGGDRRSVTARARSIASRPQSFVAATAAITPFAPRTIQRLLRIGESILPELQDTLAPTPLANRQEDLYRIASMTSDGQRALMKRLQDAEQPPPSLAALITDPNKPSSPRKSNLDGLKALWSKSSANQRRHFIQQLWAEASDSEREGFREWLADPDAQP